MGQKNVYGTQQWKYILSVVKDNTEYSTEAHRLFTVGQNYLAYLQSTRNYLELQTRYKGLGERSPGDMAKLMGFRMPDEPVLSRKNKSKG
ncbi:unnamed protein product [Allacma fusca]|uniref:Protein FMC1 homolog n=1 Tax=Allacma fusca TaxID=39272 RepID=A0A8J2JYF2_9HEXA|nr:unnamed protein product [Allacma fusca]